jgi:hypothetical protein
MRSRWIRTALQEGNSLHVGGSPKATKADGIRARLRQIHTAYAPSHLNIVSNLATLRRTYLSLFRSNGRHHHHRRRSCRLCRGISPTSTEARPEHHVDRSGTRHHWASACGEPGRRRAPALRRPGLQVLYRAAEASRRQAEI